MFSNTIVVGESCQTTTEIKRAGGRRVGSLVAAFSLPARTQAESREIRHHDYFGLSQPSHVLFFLRSLRRAVKAEVTTLLTT